MEGALLYYTGKGHSWPGSSEEQPLTITARPAPNAAPVRLKVRKSIDSLSAQELADFRRAVKQALALNDKRGLDYFASWHGVPFGWCQHHDARFLPWHRAYLY